MAQQRAQRPPQIHKPEDNDEFTALVDQQGCGKLYWTLEECMNKNDRSLIACSKEMTDWRRCYADFKAREQQQQQQMSSSRSQGRSSSAAPSTSRQA